MGTLSTYEACKNCRECDGYGCKACLGDLLNPPASNPDMTARMRRQAADARDRMDDFWRNLGREDAR